MVKKLILGVCLAGTVACGLGGCAAPVIFGGAALATGATVSSLVDRRSTGASINDGVMESRIPWEISKAIGDVDSHITVTCYNGKVLLSGEIGSEKAKRLAGKTAAESLDVGSVVNELAVMPSASLTQRLSDTALATKVRSRLLANENVYLNQMKVVVERGIVYLMGVVTPAENKVACEVAATTSGVVRVISITRIMTPSEIAKMERELEEIRKRQEMEKEFEK